MIKPAKNSHTDCITLLLGRTAFTELRLGIMPLTYIKDAIRNNSIKSFTLFTGMILLLLLAIYQVANSLRATFIFSALKNI